MQKATLQDRSPVHCGVALIHAKRSLAKRGIYFSCQSKPGDAWIFSCQEKPGEAWILLLAFGNLWKLGGIQDLRTILAKEDDFNGVQTDVIFAPEQVKERQNAFPL